MIRSFAPPRAGDPTPQYWVDAPTLRLLPGEREKFEATAREYLRDPFAAKFRIRHTREDRHEYR